RRSGGRARARPAAIPAAPRWGPGAPTGGAPRAARRWRRGSRGGRCASSAANLPGAPALVNLLLHMPRLLVLFVTAFVDMVGLTMILPLLPFYAKDLGASAAVVGLL